MRIHRHTDIHIDIYLQYIYEQVHLYISICLITGWGSKGAATARLLPYMGGTLTYTKVMYTYICIYKSHLHTSTHTYIFYA